jgi:hypothetical protein
MVIVIMMFANSNHIYKESKFCSIQKMSSLERKTLKLLKTEENDTLNHQTAQ